MPEIIDTQTIFRCFLFILYGNIIRYHFKATLPQLAWPLPSLFFCFLYILSLLDAFELCLLIMTFL